MKALVFEEHGSIDNLKVLELPEPRIKRNEVLIKLSASALNHLDLFVLKGWKGLNLKFPHICGADGTGTVLEVGDGVLNLKIGDEVVINPGISCMRCDFCLNGENSLCKDFGILGEHFEGTFAEYVSVPFYNLEIAPPHLDKNERAGFPLTFLTSYRMLFSKGKIKAGDKILIHGISSGVSIACLIFSKISGCTAIVTSSKDEALSKAKEIGADFLINYKNDNVFKKIMEITNGEGVDIVIDSVGKDTWITSLKSVKKGGKIITCGATSGPNPEEEIRLIFWKQIEILGSTMSSVSEFKEMVNLVKEKKLKPVIDSVFSIEDGRSAYEKLEEGRQFGKIILNL